MIALLINFIIALIVVAIVYAIFVVILGLLPLPPAAKQIALAICLLILLVWLLGIFAGGGDWRVVRLP